MGTPKRRLVVVVALVSLMLSGCWGQIGFDGGHSRYNSGETTLTRANAWTLEPVWSVDLLQQASEPMVRGGRVYLTTWTPDTSIDVRALSEHTGATEWNTPLLSTPANAAFWATPATFLGDELWSGFVGISVVAGRPYGDFKAPVRIDPADGTIIAKDTQLAASAAIETDGYAVQNYFEIGSTQWLLVRDAATLEPAWKASFSRTQVVPVPKPYPMAVADGRVFVVDDTGVLYMFPLAGCGAATCTPTWTYDLGITANASQPVAVGDQVFVVAGDPTNPDLGNGSLLAIDAATGPVNWADRLGDAGTFVERDLAATGDQVYGTARTSLFAFASDESCQGHGCNVWTGLLPSAATASPVAAGYAVYVGVEGAVLAFGVEGCRESECGPVATIPVEGTPDHLVVDDGKLFVVHRPSPGAPAKLTAFAPAVP